MKGLLLFMLVFISFVSCKRDENEVIVDLQSVPEEYLRADSLNLSGKLLIPIKIFSQNDYLILLEDKDKEGFIHVYNTKGQFIGRYGCIGNAGNEFLSPTLFRNGNRIIVVSMDGKFCEFRYSDSGADMTDMKEVPDKRINMGINFLGISGTSDYIIESASAKDMLSILRKDGELTEYNYYPVRIPDRIDPYLKKSTIATRTFIMSDKLDGVMMAFDNYPVVNILNLNDMSNRVVRLDVKDKNEYKIKFGAPCFENPILFYTYCTAYGNMYSGLYQNMTIEQMKKGAGFSEVHLFSDDGKFLKRYILDRVVYHFAVDEGGHKIYALGFNKALLPEIYVYSI